MSKKQATKTPKTPISARAGQFVGTYGPGAIKKLGRATGKGAVGFKRATGIFTKAMHQAMKDA